MKLSNKQIMSLILSGALITSPTVAHANTKQSTSNPYTYYVSYEGDDEEIYYLDGIYTDTTNDKPVYVYLGNGLSNKYLTLYDALEEAETNYRNTYIYKKKILNPNYKKGINEKYITMYALSGKTRVSGWTRINEKDLYYEDKVATTIELGEFLLKQINLGKYKYNMRGFANIDINGDGYNDGILYVGNNKNNIIFDNKSDAIKYGLNDYENFYFYKKTILNPNYNNDSKKYITVYTISNKENVSGWTRTKQSDVPSNAFIGSNPEFMNIYISMGLKVYVTEKDEDYVPEYKPDKPTNPDYNGNYNYLKKDKALLYGYSHYKEDEIFCIIMKTITGPKNRTETIYCLNPHPDVPGWTIIGDDFIPSNAYIFLSLQDAENYEYDFTNGYTRELR